MNGGGLLSGIRVLDLTNVLSGPFATVHLALLGAEVIKIENPADGDLARKLGCVPEYNRKLMGTSFLAQNANKKSMTLNLKAPEGKKIFRTLVSGADVLVENFRPDVMKRLGTRLRGPERDQPAAHLLRDIRDRPDGPRRAKPAYDQIIQGLSGEMAINGDERLSPLRAGFPVCDTVAGLNAAFAVMAALYHRQRTGEGQSIDVALLDSIMPLMGWVVANLMIGGQEPVLMGNDNFTAAPSGVFRTGDGHINIAANKQEQWESVADVLGVPHLKSDVRFAARDERKKNRKELSRLLEEKLANEGNRRVGGGAERARRPRRRDTPARRGGEPAPGRAQGRLRYGDGAGDRRTPPVQPDGEVLEDPGARHRPTSRSRGAHGRNPRRARDLR